MKAVSSRSIWWAAGQHCLGDPPARSGTGHVLAVRDNRPAPAGPSGISSLSTRASPEKTLHRLFETMEKNRGHLEHPLRHAFDALWCLPRSERGPDLKSFAIHQSTTQHTPSVEPSLCIVDGKTTCPHEKAPRSPPGHRHALKDTAQPSIGSCSLALTISTRP